jgi:methylglyoxal synthase
VKKVKRIALVAHDNRKKVLAEWVEWNYRILQDHKIICTGTTGKMIEKVLKNKHMTEKTGKRLAPIKKLKSGPLGGDQQLGAMIAEGKIDVLIFFWDPMEPQPHDVDVKALLRIAVLYNIPVASNRSSADFLISSPLISEEYDKERTSYSDYMNRKI